MNYWPQKHATFRAQKRCAIQWTQCVRSMRERCSIVRNRGPQRRSRAHRERILRMRQCASRKAAVYERWERIF